MAHFKQFRTRCYVHTNSLDTYVLSSLLSATCMILGRHFYLTSGFPLGIPLVKGHNILTSYAQETVLQEVNK